MVCEGRPLGRGAGLWHDRRALLHLLVPGRGAPRRALTPPTARRIKGPSRGGKEEMRHSSFVIHHSSFIIYHSSFVVHRSQDEVGGVSRGGGAGGRSFAYHRRHQ